MNEAEIREAISLLKPKYRIDDNPEYDQVDEAIDVLISLAESYLEVGGKLPKKKELLGQHLDSYQQAENMGWNYAIDAYLLAHVAEKQRILEALSEEKILDAMRGCRRCENGDSYQEPRQAKAIRKLVEEVAK